MSGENAHPRRVRVGDWYRFGSAVRCEFKVRSGPDADSFLDHAPALRETDLGDTPGRAPICLACGRFDRHLAQKPASVILDEHTLNCKRVTQRTKRGWVESPVDSPVKIIRKELLDSLWPYVMDRWIIGEVTVGQEKPATSYASFYDPGFIDHRVAANTPNDMPSHLGPCPECGRVSVFQRMNEPASHSCVYLLAKDLDRSGPVVETPHGILVARSVVNELGLFDRELWPGSRCVGAQVYDSPRDALPAPIPGDWNALEDALGHPVEFPKFFLPNDRAEPGAWLARRIVQDGLHKCIDQHDSTRPCGSPLRRCGGHGLLQPEYPSKLTLTQFQDFAESLREIPGIAEAFRDDSTEAK